MSRWHKSTYSGGDDDSDCVEVDYRDSAAALRDSKNPAESIKLSGHTFRAFVRLACGYGDAAR